MKCLFFLSYAFLFKIWTPSIFTFPVHYVSFRSWFALFPWWGFQDSFRIFVESAFGFFSKLNKVKGKGQNLFFYSFRYLNSDLQSFQSVHWSPKSLVQFLTILFSLFFFFCQYYEDKLKFFFFSFYLIMMRDLLMLLWI